MKDFLENIGAILLGMFALVVTVGAVLIVQPWFWLAVIAYILVTHL